MAEYRLWPATNGPSSQASDTDDYAMGVEFYVTTAADIEAIHFWASTNLAGTFTGRVYSVDTGGTTGSAVTGTDVTFGSITGPGWNTATLAAPVALTPNQRYRATVAFTTTDGYTITPSYWNSSAGLGGALGISNGPLEAPNADDAEGNRQGSFTGSSTMAFPASQFNQSNYWVDITIDDGLAPTGTAALPLGGLTLRVGGGYTDTYSDSYGYEVIVTRPAAATLALGSLTLTALSTTAPPPVDPDIDGLNLSLWAVDKTTGAISPLPHFVNLALSRERNGIGRISVDYPYYGRNFDLLADNITDDRDLEVEIWVSGRRAGALRGIFTDTTGDDVAEDAVWRFEGHFLELLLDEVLVWPQSGAAKQELILSAANPGQILATLIGQAQARGGLVGVTRGFTTSVDSAGDAWPTVVTATFSPQATMLDVLQELIEIGMIDGFELTAGRVLQMWGPGNQGTDLTVTPPSTGTPIFRRGRNLTQSPRRHTVRNSGTTALAAGSENLYAATTNATALSRRGRRIEIAGSANSLQDSGSVSAFATAMALQISPGTQEVTHGLVFGDGHPRPLIDFFGGDWVWSDTRGDLEKLRVHQLELEYGVDGYAGTVVLNTPITDRLIAMARKLKRMASGTAVVGTSTVTPETDDGKLPAQVVGVTASSAAYVGNDGVTWASVQAGWTAVTTNADGSGADDIVGYYPAYRYTGAGMPTDWQVLPQVAASPADWSGIVPGKTIEVRVAAVDKFGHVGAWSTAYGLTSGADATPPPTPSTPVVDSYLGILTVAWDGLGSSAEAQPVDFDRVEVHVSTSSGFTPSTGTRIDTLRRSGTVAWDGGSYGTTYYGKLVAYDKTGNASSASAQDSAVLSQAGDGDISALSVGKLTAGIMSAIMTLSGIIRTASSGDRVEIDSDGIHCYDGSTLVFDFDISAGTVYLRGTVEAYQSSTDRIVIQPSGAGASGVSLSEISFYAQATSPGYINAVPISGGRTLLGLNSGNSADSGTTRHQSTLMLQPLAWNLQVNTAPGDAAGTNVRRGGFVAGDQTSVEMALTESTSDTQRARIAGSGDDVLVYALDEIVLESRTTISGGIRDGGYVWLRAATGDTYFGHYDDGSVDTYLRFDGDGDVVLRRGTNQYAALTGSTTELRHSSSIRVAQDDSETIIGQGGNTFIKLNNSGSLEFFEGGTGYSSLSALKSFVIDHPVDPDRLLVHVCSESPTAGVEYWGEALVSGGRTVVELPSYFEALTETTGRTVHLTQTLGCDDEDDPDFVQLAAGRIRDGRFVVRVDTQDPVRVSWLVKATRRNAVFDVEPLRSDVNVAGSGPYRWISPDPVPDEENT